MDKDQDDKSHNSDDQDKDCHKDPDFDLDTLVG